SQVQVGNRSALLPLASARWAHRPNPEAYYPTSLIDSLTQALKVNDVILVRAVSYADFTRNMDAADQAGVPKNGQLVTLEQDPRLQGALISLDPLDGYVSSLIGGYDVDASEFNRAMQS